MGVGGLTTERMRRSATSSSVLVTGQVISNTRAACSRVAARTSGRSDRCRSFPAMLCGMSTDRPLVVSVIVADGLVGSFGPGGSAKVFGYDRRHIGLPRFDFALVSEAPGVLRTDTGIPITVEHGLERLACSDIISITAWELFDRVPSPVLLDAVREAYARGATLISHCTGAFVLAKAGLLDGKRVTTHWKWAGELAARYPAVQVDPSVLYVDNGRILTGAGTAAGVDTLLHLVRREWGAAAANALAREMVVPPHRDGGQAQFIDAPVAAAEELLENSDAPVEEIARLVGFGTAAGLRDQFTRRRGVSPRAYRQTFRAAHQVVELSERTTALQHERNGAGGVRADHAPAGAGLGQPAEL